ncbi:MAG TPA: TM2 domain-containing protein [Gemmatimonadales bacterium]|nr:TM2 domain-containing protein [Gemmatimonadales bacterium]
MADVSDKSRGIAFILAIVLGVFGAHRFYVGKIGTGILMLCTVGGLGIWYLYDVIMVAAGSFRDADDRRVLRWDPESGEEMHSELSAEVIEELEALRKEVAELSERVDFTERLLQRQTSESPPT